MKKIILSILLLFIYQQVFCWGFFAHKKINYFAVFLLPPEMMVLYKANIDFISEHAVDPDKRRYMVAAEGPRHYIDIDYYGKYPYPELPHKWDDAIKKFSEDSVRAYGIVPWWIDIMLGRLTKAFKEKNQAKILKLSAEIGHYILLMRMCLCMQVAIIMVSSQTNKAFMVFGNRAYQNYWLIKSGIFLLAKHHTFPIRMILFGNVF